MKLFAKLFVCIALVMGVTTLRAQSESVTITPPTAQAETTDAEQQSAASSSITEIDPSEMQPTGWVKTGEYTVKNPESGEWETHDSYGPAPKSLSDLYVEGGYVWMSLITICLIGILFAAWKAPRWVKEIGLLALILGVIYFLIGIYEISGILSGVEIGKDISPSLFFGGLRVALIAPLYGLIVYGISLILRLVFKPRI